MSTIKSYVGNDTWRIKENASSGYSVGAMNGLLAGKASAEHWLHDVYPKEIGDAHKEAKIHIHDLNQVAVYCNGWSLRQLIQEGLGGVPNEISSKPAKHLATLVQQMVNFLGLMSNESAGAQAFSSVDTYLAPYVKEGDEGVPLTYRQTKQCIQSLVFNLNIPSRWAGMAPFTNVTFDAVVPEDMAGTPCYFGGELLDYTYSECQDEMDMINKAFLEVMIEGDANGRTFSYPIPTYNITESFDWEHPNSILLFEMTGKYGTPYFQNFINSDLNPSDVRSMCCRLQLDKRELRKRGGGLFGADEFTGSIGVVTLNMPNIALSVAKYYESQSQTIKEGIFFDFLADRMDLAKESLELKRTELVRLNNQEDGRTLYPYTKRYLPNGWKNHFSTIGLNGMNEAIMTMFGSEESTGSEIGIAFTEDVLKFMRDKLQDYQEETGNLYNLEASPAEGTSYRLAKHDLKEFGHKIPHQGTIDACYYTNSTQLPVNFTEDIFEALELQDGIQTLYTGGTVHHGHLGEEITDAKVVAELVKKICYGFKLPYFTISPIFSVCEDHGYLRGEQFECPECSKETEVYARIVGYYRPIKRWNKGKAKEYTERVTFEVN